MNFGNNDFDGLKCLHCHIFENMVDIVSLLRCEDVKKYNIVSNDDVQFVHIFSEQNSTYISCMSGVCQHGFGKKRKLESLREHQNLCIHLEVFREFMVNSGGCNFFWFLF